MLYSLLVALAAGGAPSDLLVSTDRDAAYVATLEPGPGQERVPARLARRELRVRDRAGRTQWSAPFRADDPGARLLVSDDGSTVVWIATTFSTSRPIVRAVRHGAELARWTGSDLGLDRRRVLGASPPARSERWIDDRGLELGWRKTTAGPLLTLALAGGERWSRRIDLSRARVIEGPSEPSPSVEPIVPPELVPDVVPPFVERFTLPAVARAGQPVPIVVSGRHATPSWRVAGFELERLDAEARALAVRPLSRPAAGRNPIHASLDAYESEVRLNGLEPGRYTIGAQGAGREHPDPVALEVLPGLLVARLETRALDRRTATFEVFSHGVVRVTRAAPDERTTTVRHATPATVQALNAALSALPTTAYVAAERRVERERLGWWSGQRWLEREASHLDARDPIRRAADVLQGL